MLRIKNLVAAIAFGGSVAIAVVSLVQVAAAAEQKISASVAKPLKAAQDATKKAQWNIALEKLKEAQGASGKTAYDEYQIDNFLAYVLFSQKKMSEAAVVYERLLNSGQMPAREVDARIKSLASIYFQLRQYDKSARWAKKLYDKNPDQPDVALVLGQSYYLLNDYKNAAATMNSLVTNAERAGQAPKEDWLRIVQASYVKLSDKEGANNALKKLVRHFNKPEDWDALLTSNARGRQGDHVALGYLRLKLAAGVLKRATDYVEMAQLAMDEKVANAPAEAEKIIEHGMANGTLKSADKAQQGRYDRLLETAKQRAAASRAGLPQLALQTQSAASGQAQVVLGQAYLSVGDRDNAISALQQGIKLGGITDADEARIDLGRAYLEKGQKDLARQSFRSVKKDSPWADLADLWSLRT